MMSLVPASSYTLPFFGPGTVVIFGIVLLPVYIMATAWFVGDPRNVEKGLMGLGYLFGLVTALWGGLFVLTMVIYFVFF